MNKAFVFILGLLISVSVRADDTESPLLPDPLKFSELMLLQTPLQVKYLTGMADLMVKTEVWQKNASVRKQKHSSWHLLINQAHAAKTDREGSKCVIAGSISKRIKHDGRLICDPDPVRKLAIGKLGYSCPGQSIICNPLVFGFKFNKKEVTYKDGRIHTIDYRRGNDRQPFCVPYNINKRDTTTRDCQNLLKPDTDAYMKYLPLMIQDTQAEKDFDRFYTEYSKVICGRDGVLDAEQCLDYADAAQSVHDSLRSNSPSGLDSDSPADSAQ